MTWISFNSNPDLKDVEFDDKNNCIQFEINEYNHPRIWLKKLRGNDTNSLIFLYRLRYAVDEAIKFNLKLENENEKGGN